MNALRWIVDLIRGAHPAEQLMLALALCCAIYWGAT